MAHRSGDGTAAGADLAIWMYAGGYLASYVPYSALTKALTRGFGPGEGLDLQGPMLLPFSSVASVLAMVLSLTVLGWWRHASQWRGLPVPSLWTAASGVATAAILLTTTFAYTIPGTSIVLMMVLMRGGVLVLAPIVDLLGGRTVRWYSWAALALSAAALADVLTQVESLALPTAAWITLAIYLAGYFARLRFMTRLAKGTLAQNRRYFVEEQLVATPFAVLTCAAMAFFVPGAAADSLRAGWSLPAEAAGWVALVGVLSQMVGMFGGLVFLEPRENSFCVPVNRASSVIAGVLAATTLTLLFDERAPSRGELTGAAMMVLATLVLGLGSRIRVPWAR